MKNKFYPAPHNFLKPTAAFFFQRNIHRRTTNNEISLQVVPIKPTQCFTNTHSNSISIVSKPIRASRIANSSLSKKQFSCNAEISTEDTIIILKEILKRLNKKPSLAKPRCKTPLEKPYIKFNNDKKRNITKNKSFAPYLVYPEEQQITSYVNYRKANAYSNCQTSTTLPFDFSSASNMPRCTTSNPVSRAKNYKDEDIISKGTKKILDEYLTTKKVSTGVECKIEQSFKYNIPIKAVIRQRANIAFESNS